MLDKILEFMMTVTEIVFILSGGDNMTALVIVGLMLSMVAVLVLGIAQLIFALRRWKYRLRESGTS